MKKLCLTLLLAALGGCQTLTPGGQPVQPKTASAAPPQKAFPEPEQVGKELNAELLFDYLVGEMGARAGKFSLAGEAYLAAAESARDAYAAERATRIALHRKDLETARVAAALWVELAPNNLEARKLYAVLLLRKGMSDKAQVQFEAMRRIAEVGGKDGLLLVTAVLAGEPDRAAARSMFERLVSRADRAADVLYARAVLDTAQKRYPEAESVLRQALQLKPDWPQARTLLSHVLVVQKRTEAVLKVLTEGLDLNPDSTLLRTSYARLLVAVGKYKEALAQFGELYRLTPDDVDTLYGYAMLASQQEQLALARGLWQKLRNEPKYYPEATYFLAQIEESDGKRQLALGLYRSVNKGPLVVDASIRAANLMRELGQKAQARTLLERVRSTHPGRTVDLYLAEAQLLQAMKAAPGEVLAVYRSALREAPGNVDLLYNRGLYYSGIGRYQAMEADFRSVLKKDPRNANALNALGYMLAERNTRLKEARGYIEQALAVNPDSAAILDSMGWVLYRLGELDAARECLQKAYAREPDDEIAAHLIEVLWAAGDKRKARELFRSASQEAPDSPHLTVLKGQLFTGGQ